MNTLKLQDGRQLAYELFGGAKGRPVVFHHGTGDSRLARHPDDRLITEAGVQLITVDRPGYGGSTPRPGRTLLDWVPDTVQLADHLGLERFAVAGWSGGGPHALAVAHELGDRISNVVLASPLGPFTAPGALKTVHREYRLLWRLRWFKPLIRMAGRDEAKKARADIAAYADNWAKEAPELDRELFAMPPIREMLEQEMSEAFRQGAAGWLGDVFAFLNWGFELEDIHTSVEIFHGGADKILFPAMGRSIAERLPQGRFHILPDEGHFCLFRHWVKILESAALGQ